MSNKRAIWPAPDDVVVTAHCRIYKIQWRRNGSCRVLSSVTGTVIARFADDIWVDQGRLPDDVKNHAMSVRP